MTTHPKHDNDLNLEEANANAQAEDENVAAEGEAEGEVSEEDVLLKLARENEELKEQNLRLVAEMENLRKRTQREVADARTFGIAGFARDMLTVSDNLQRALGAITPEQRETAEPVLKSLAEGVEMTERSMLSTLERHGVKRLNPEGERFDPNFHQAMFEVPNPDVAANTVVQVVQPGYVIGERVLRPAMVGVSKGGPKASAEKQQADAEQASSGDAS